MKGCLSNVSGIVLNFHEIDVCHDSMNLLLHNRVLINLNYKETTGSVPYQFQILQIHRGNSNYVFKSFY
jgi:hypothetical protein